MPIDSDIADRRARRVVLVCLFIAFVAALAMPTERERWDGSVKVVRTGEDDALLKSALRVLIAGGVEKDYAARVVGDLGRLVEARVAAGQTTTLRMGVIVDSVRAGHTAGWPAADSARFLVGLQTRMESGAGLPEERLRALLSSAELGGTVDQVLRGDSLVTENTAAAGAPR